MTKKVKNLMQLKSTKFNPVVMALFAVVLAVAGYFIIFSKAAPPPPTIYLNPASNVVAARSTVTMEIRENSGTTGVNASRVFLSFPSSLVSFTTTDITYSPYWSNSAGTTIGTGTLSIDRGAAFCGSDGFIPNTTKTAADACTAGQTAVLTGDHVIATITLHMSATGGAANLAFTSGTVLVNSSTNQDILGGLSATAGATYTIDTAAPNVSVTAPANNATLALGSTPTITATASDASSSVTKVEIYIDGTLKTTLTTSPYNYVWNTGVTAGAHTIQAKGYDTFNNIGTSTLVNVTVTDQTAPTVSVTAPTAGSFVAGSAVTLSANASDNVGVAGVQFKVDGTNVGAEDTTSPYSVSWSTTGLTNGAHTVTAVARDAAGNTTTSSSVSTTVDNAAPTVSITSPTSGAIVNGTVTVNTTAADNTGGSGLSKVELYVDGVLNSTDTATPYNFSWNTTALAFGSSHTLTAKAYDNVAPANVTTSSGVTVTVNDTTAPTTPTNFRTTTVLPTSVTVAWNASTDNVAVTGYQVRRGSTLLTTTSSLSYTDSGLTPSTAYSYTVTAVDAASNSSAPATLSATTLPLKPGDIDQNNVVDLTDLSYLISSYNSPTDPCITNTAFSCGLIAPVGVDIFDLSVLLSNYGK
jgi:chitodextrinase